MPYKNHILTGLLIGLVLPAISYVVFNVLYADAILLNKPAIPYLVAMGLNLIIIKLCFKRDADQTAKGVMLITFAFLLFMVFVLKIKL